MKSYRTQTLGKLLFGFNLEQAKISLELFIWISQGDYVIIVAKDLFFNFPYIAHYATVYIYCKVRRGEAEKCGNAYRAPQARRGEDALRSRVSSAAGASAGRRSREAEKCDKAVFLLCWLFLLIWVW